MILAPPPDDFEQLAPRVLGQPFNPSYSGMTDVRPQSAQRR